jgi:cell wall-associated NlpC family hydrolase
MRPQSLVSLLTLLACTPLVVAAQADDLDRFLNERGLVEPTVQQQALPGSGARVTSPQAQPDAAPSARVQASDRMSDLVVAAMGAIGVPYRIGGNTYDSGFDCSGFVRAVYAQNVGVTLPRMASQQAAATHVIERGELQPGDLVFFNTQRRAFSHVGIYVGDHKFIHSPRPGAVVRIEDMRVGYWSRRFDGARRVTGPGAAHTLPATSTTSSLALPSY